MKNYVQDGTRMTWKNATSAKVASGGLVAFDAMVGIATTDIAAGTVGELATRGVYLLPKESAASGKDFTQGAAVYVDADGKLTSAASVTSGSDTTANKRVGVCFESAASTASVVSVKIN